MELETIKMSSKGQIVIPQEIRNEMHASEGTLFAVVGGRDTILLKKIEPPSKEELIKDLKDIAAEGRKRLEKIGLKESDIPQVVKKSRRGG